MGLSNIFGISSSAMSSQSVRMNTTASNLANAETLSSTEKDAYRARHPVFQTMIHDFEERLPMHGISPSSGVMVKGIVESQAPVRPEYQPHHPMADEKGFVYKPNVNVVEELTNMISASRSYQTNVEAMKTSKDLLMKTLTLGQ